MNESLQQQRNESNMFNRRAEGLSSAEKNQRVMLTGGMNSARNYNEDVENIEPNNNYSFENQNQYFKSFQSID